MPDWLIAAPVWGDAYLRRFLEAALPAQRAALAHAGLTARWIVHTDRPDAVISAMAGLDIDLRPPPLAGDLYRRFGDAHRQALDAAGQGDFVALLSADIVVSREAFAACEARFAEGAKAVVAAATRTLTLTEPPTYPPPGVPSVDLLDWCMAHPHPMVQACFWPSYPGPHPTGYSNTPWAVYFASPERTILRGFHLHPLAVVADRPLPFTGTLDQDLLANFSHGEIHVVTDRHELAMAEISPAERAISLRRRPMTAETIAEWARQRALPVHRWLSTHRIVIQGDDGPAADLDVWPRVLALCP